LILNSKNLSKWEKVKVYMCKEAIDEVMEDERESEDDFLHKNGNGMTILE
jgi:hypothetical protein